MIQQLLSIAHNTFIESIRQPVFVVLIITGLLMLALSPSLAAYTLSDDNKLLVDLGLSTVFVLCLLLAGFTATNVLAEEVENRTVLTVVSKPVARPTFVLGKFLGVAGAISLAFYILGLAFLFARRHGVLMTVRDPSDWPVITFGMLAIAVALLVAAAGNYLYRWVFSSTFTGTLGIAATVAALLAFSFSKQWELQAPWTDFTAEDATAPLGQIAVGLVLVFEAVLVLTAVAIAASTRLGQIMTLIVCIGVFIIGLINSSFSWFVDNQLNLPPDMNAIQGLGAILFADVSLHLKFFYALAKLLYLLLPNLQFLWPADALAAGSTITTAHVATVTAYSVLSITMILSLAVILFQRREVG